ncbi:5-formyltetrahydrofolate cyclo-ligase [Sphingomonas ginkgonis]|uniref:5-formyltetrahydrofolate cyclo-ligase n=1 Tax=Sphingomonas ginkgonis TaxID=2315330 RepID=A0A3R9Y642_9SPHN|nr:5-formyltetrahydrofolate cyclo-ligase [Sphingomonas ginkgonis]RST30929.1 5-formyltetrahydrofolate cyclo-ligase [Sphingomonas ginkgonis]
MAVPSPSPVADKQALRAAMRERRRAYAASLSHDTRLALEQALVETAAPLLLSARVVAGYQPMKDEMSVLPLLAAAEQRGLVTALPAFAARDARMSFRAGPPLDPGPWGILQPAPEAPTVAPDLVIVPLLAIDRRGNRIGMGKGHYDRALPGLREEGARLIGAGWAFQRVAEPIAADPWDVPLDGFLSPEGLEEFKR